MSGNDEWSVWKEIYLTGTEWHLYEKVLSASWNFDNLRHALEDPTGKLATSPNPVYLFGATEGQLVGFEVVLIPVIIAVASACPLPSEIALKSVQKTDEELRPMRQMKMSWAPYIPKSYLGDPFKFKANAFYLHCKQRLKTLKSLTKAQARDYEYALPYIPIPREYFADIKQANQDFEVRIVDSYEGVGLCFDYKPSSKSLEKTVQKQIVAHGLPNNEETRTALTLKINEQLFEAQTRLNKENDEKLRRIGNLTRKQQQAYDNLYCIKFYPTNPSVAHCKAPFINRYFGKAQEVI